MKNPGEKQPEIESGQPFDAAMSVACAAVAATMIAYSVNLAREHAPDWGGAVAGIGFMALVFTGLAVHEWRLFTGTASQDSERQ